MDRHARRPCGGSIHPLPTCDELIARLNIDELQKAAAGRSSRRFLILLFTHGAATSEFSDDTPEEMIDFSSTIKRGKFNAPRRSHIR
jgi:hypothetical protein